MKKLLFLLFFIPSIAYALPASIFYSDLTDAPNTGWEESATKGAAVTIYGRGFGTSRGTSYVTIGGVNLTNASDYAEWGATTNPTTARGDQRITFFLNSSMSTGSTTITVTNADGASNSIPFYIRSLGSNHIYYISTTGSDSNSGLDGTTNAWLQLRKARATLTAGDICYVRAGTYNTNTNSANENCANSQTNLIYFSAGDGAHNNGSANNSIAIVAYPAELVQLGANYNASPIDHIILNCSDSPSDLKYWTFAKFVMRSDNLLIFLTELNWTSTNIDNIRIVGNDMQTYYVSDSAYSAISLWGGTNIYIYGNYIHDLGLDYRGSGQEYRSHCYPIYIAGFGTQDYIYIGYNEMSYNPYSRGIQVYGHINTDSVDHLYIFGNYSHDNGYQGLNVGGGDPEGGTSYSFVRRAYIYNNVLWNNCTANGGFGNLQLGDGSSGDEGGLGQYVVYGNTIGGSSDTGGELCIAYSSSSGNGTHASDIIKNNIIYPKTGVNYYMGQSTAAWVSGGNNCYYNGINIPVWDTTYINADPLFNSSPTDFSLTSSSPCKDAGEDLSAIYTTDYLGGTRPYNSIFDIGAFEYGSSASGGGDSPGDPEDVPNTFTVKIIGNIDISGNFNLQ